MLPRIFAVTTTLGAIWLASASAGQEKTDKLDEQAKAVAEQFTRAYVLEMNVDKTMKLVAVPFLQMTKSGNPEVLTKIEDVRKHFVAVLADKKPNKELPPIREVITYEQLLAKEKIDGKMRDALDKVLKKTDRIVTMRMAVKDDGTGYATMVSWRDGQPKVVGYIFAFRGPAEKKKALALVTEKEVAMDRQNGEKLTITVKYGKIEWVKIDPGDKGVTLEKVGDREVKVAVIEAAEAVESYKITIKGKDDDGKQKTLQVTLKLKK